MAARQIETPDWIALSNDPVFHNNNYLWYVAIMSLWEEKLCVEQKTMLCVMQSLWKLEQAVSLFHLSHTLSLNLQLVLEYMLLKEALFLQKNK